MDVWEHYQKRREKIHKKYPDLCNQCKNTIENLWLIVIGIHIKLKEHGKKLPPEKSFNLTFFYRNTSYLISAYKLAEEGLVNPARNILRTVYEQILRSILFTKYPDEAELWINYWETKNTKLEKEIKKRGYWSAKYMRNKLYAGKMNTMHEEFYDEISRYAHPHVRAALDDIYVIRKVDDVMKGILDLSYTVVNILPRTFPNLIDEELHSICEDTKELIGSYLSEVSSFTPNK